MPRPRAAIIFRTRPKAVPLPAWVAEFTLLFTILANAGRVAWLKANATIRRQGGYVGFDLLLFGLAYFVAPPSGGFKGFWDVTKNAAGRIAKIAARNSLPSTAAVSRLLAAANRMPDPDSFVAALLGQGSECAALLRSTLGQHRDALGEAWSMFDLDPTVHARRLRALPEGEDLPSPERRGAAWCLPGYTGRKRGETQFSTLMVSHAGTGLWAFTDVVPGNTPFAAATARAAMAIVRLAKWAVLDTARLLLRFDGAGGHYEAIAGAVHAGVHYLTRLGSYHVLEQPGVAEHLATAVWRDVPDSGSGPRRQATELGNWALSKEQFVRETADQQALRARLVVSRFPAAADGKKRGAGMVIGPWQYEVFATDLAANAWPAADCVTLYYGRCGQENAFAACYDELRLGDVFCESPSGQRLMTAIAMWVANLRRVAAAALPGDLGPALEQQPRPQEAEGSPDAGQSSPASPSSTVAEAQPTPAAASVAEPAAAPAAATAAESQPEPVALEPKVLAQVPATVMCPAGLPMPFVGMQEAKGARVYARYGDYRAPCAGCPDRKLCTRRTDTEYRRTMTIPVSAELLPLRRAIAAHYRAAAGLTAQQVTPPPLGPSPTQALAVAASAQPRQTTPSKPQSSRPPRLSLTQPVAPGPLLPQAPCLYMSALLHQWQQWVAIHRVEVVLQPATRPVRRPWVRETAARRQCRRQTYAERLLYNATRQPSQVEVIRYVG